MTISGKDCQFSKTPGIALLEHTLWWNRSTWLALKSSQWPKPVVFAVSLPEDTEIYLVSMVKITKLVVYPEKYRNVQSDLNHGMDSKVHKLW